MTILALYLLSFSPLLDQPRPAFRCAPVKLRSLYVPYVRVWL